MRNTFLVHGLACAIMILAFSACKKSSSPTSAADSSQTSTTVVIDSSTTAAQVLAANRTSHEEPNDYIWDTTQVVTILLNGNSITESSGSVTINGTTATITSSGNYRITGSLTDGQIVVHVADKGTVRIILNGVSLSNSTTAPLYIASAQKVILILTDNTQNYVTDPSTYVYANANETEPNAAIFSTADLTICGNGSLTVKGNYNDGIASKDGLIIAGGTIIVNSVDDGIRGKDYLIINNGTLTVTSTGDGLKSDNEDDAAKGYILIESGTIKVASGTDALAAKTDVVIVGGQLALFSGGGSYRTVSGTTSAKGIKGLVCVIIEGGTLNVNSADDALHSNASIVVNGGTLALASGDDGIHSNTAVIVNGGDISITRSYEGIESASITVNNGTISIVASDDGFNATEGTRTETNDGSFLRLNGGIISVNTTIGDGLDSNGSIAITGGIIIVHGPQSQPEVGMDYNGTCNISGGFLVISGTNSNMTQGASTTSTQNSLKLVTNSTIAAGTLFHIQDASGNDIVTFKPVRNYSSIVFSSPSLQKGSTYYIYTGGTSTGTLANGLYKDGTYTSGAPYTSFTISSTVTALGTTATTPGGRP
jgi:hypothetical protein